jgi:hypothetical protein
MLLLGVHVSAQEARDQQSENWKKEKKIREKSGSALVE